MFDSPKANEFTQGTVFTCAYAENYTACKIHGLVITARCDATQEKIPIFSYIPVVTISDWILTDGARIALDRIDAACINGMKNHLKAAQLSESLISTKTLDEIYQAHYLPKETDRQWTAKCTKIKILVGTSKENERLRNNLSDIENLKKHLIANQSELDNVVKELSGHRLAGHYLLRHLESIDQTPGDYVALLREIHHIPNIVAKKITNGLSKEAWGKIESSHSNCPHYVGSDDIALPVAKLKSPWIEHLMQNFSMLFSRIGVADNDFKSVKKSLSAIGFG